MVICRYELESLRIPGKRERSQTKTVQNFKGVTLENHDSVIAFAQQD